MKKLFTLFLTVVVIAAFAFAQEAGKKAAPEAKAAPAAELAKTAPVAATTGTAKMKGEIAVKVIPAQTCATLYLKAIDYAPKEGYKADHEGFTKAYMDMMGNGFEKLGKWMMDSKVTPTGPSFGVYFEDPSKVKSPSDLTCKVGVPVAAGTKGTEEIKVETIPEKSCAVVQYEGGYDQADGVWGALNKWIKDNNYVESGAPSELYIKGVKDTQNPSEYLTEIHQPVKKMDAKAEKSLKKEAKAEAKEMKKEKEEKKEEKK